MDEHLNIRNIDIFTAFGHPKRFTVHTFDQYCVFVGNRSHKYGAASDAPPVTGPHTVCNSPSFGISL